MSATSATYARPAWRSWYKTKAWKLKRQRQLAAEPTCRHCASKGVTKAATIADHVEPHRGDPVKFWEGELQSLCKPCHDRWKQSLERRGYSREIGDDGWPCDRKHPGNNASAITIAPKRQCRPPPNVCPSS